MKTGAVVVLLVAVAVAAGLAVYVTARRAKPAREATAAPVRKAAAPAKPPPKVRPVARGPMGTRVSRRRQAGQR